MEIKLEVFNIQHITDTCIDDNEMSFEIMITELCNRLKSNFNLNNDITKTFNCNNITFTTDIVLR